MLIHPVLLLFREKYTDRGICIIFAFQIVQIGKILLIDNGDCHIQLAKKIPAILCNPDIKRLFSDFFHRTDPGIGRYHIVCAYKSIDFSGIKLLCTAFQAFVIHDLNFSIILFLPFFKCSRHSLIGFQSSNLFSLIRINISTFNGVVIIIFVNVKGLVQHFAVRIIDQLDTVTGIGHPSHQINFPIYKLFKQICPFAIHVFIFPACVGRQLLEIFIAVAAFRLIISGTLLKIVGVIVAYTHRLRFLCICPNWKKSYKSQAQK